MKRESEREGERRFFKETDDKIAALTVLLASRALCCAALRFLIAGREGDSWLLCSADAPAIKAEKEESETIRGIESKGCGSSIMGWLPIRYKQIRCSCFVRSTRFPSLTLTNTVKPIYIFTEIRASVA